MKLSIVTINYNNVEGLKKTLSSVVEQSYRDIEHIIIDGGSTDGSVDAIKEYVAANPSNDPFFKHTINWVYDSKFIYTEAGDGDDDHNLQVADPFPAEVFDSDLPDGYGEETGINPVIHTIDSDGTHRYFDMQGRQLKSRPSKGIYIDNGNKIIK
jgi:glycosyltransferase involved in cell wall biosynthesis